MTEKLFEIFFYFLQQKNHHLESSYLILSRYSTAMNIAIATESQQIL